VSDTLSLSIRHHTGFTYDGLAKSSYNEARMTPISSQSQEVRHTHVAVQPVVPISTHTDYFGTIVTAFDIQEPHPRLEVEARSTVESRAQLIDPAISWHELTTAPLVDFFSEYLLATDRTMLSGDVLASIDDWRGIADLHGCADAVGEYVRAHVKYLPGATSVSATAQEAWDIGEGVCQDITHITIGLLRELGIPSRYVSGYLYPSDHGEVGVAAAGQSHAWVEYFSGAWTGMDPTNGIPETERHIFVGSGRDYDDVAPLKGVYQGAASSSLGVIVEMTRTH
jgi:transglutaminase-like putative cysteine protease